MYMRIVSSIHHECDNRLLMYASRDHNFKGSTNGAKATGSANYTLKFYQQNIIWRKYWPCFTSLNDPQWTTQPERLLSSGPWIRNGTWSGRAMVEEASVTTRGARFRAASMSLRLSRPVQTWTLSFVIHDRSWTPFMTTTHRAKSKTLSTAASIRCVPGIRSFPVFILTFTTYA